MARFGVYRNPEGPGYLLDIQADLLSHLNTRAVVPLLAPDLAPKPAATLNPALDIDGVPMVMVTQFMAAVPVQMLKTQVAHVEARRGDITAAIDLLFQGF